MFQTLVRLFVFVLGFVLENALTGHSHVSMAMAVATAKKPKLVITGGPKDLSGKSQTQKTAEAMSKRGKSKAEESDEDTGPAPNQMAFGTWNPPSRTVSFVKDARQLQDERDDAEAEFQKHTSLSLPNRKKEVIALKDAMDSFKADYPDATDADFARQYDKTVPYVFGKPCSHDVQKKIDDPIKQRACNKCRANGFRFNKTWAFIRNSISSLNRSNKGTSRTAPNWRAAFGWIMTQVFGMSHADLNTVGKAIAPDSKAPFGNLPAKDAKKIPESYTKLMDAINSAGDALEEVIVLDKQTMEGTPYYNIGVPQKQTESAKRERVKAAEKAGAKKQASKARKAS